MGPPKLDCANRTMEAVSSADNSELGAAEPNRSAGPSASARGAASSLAGASGAQSGAPADSLEDLSESSNGDNMGENATLSEEKDVSDGLQSGFEREHVQGADADGSAAASSSSAAALEQPAVPQAGVPDEPDSPLTATAVAERAAAMFVVGSAGTQASGRPPFGSAATKQLVQLAFTAVNELCDELGTQLSDSFGNFDRVVGLGWLLGDAVGAPLLSQKQAHAVGLKARRDAVAIKAAIKDLKKPASRIKKDDPKRQEAEVQAENKEAALLRETIDLGITTPVQPAASGERKRKRELELSEEQLLGIADSHLLKAEKAVDKAVEQAEETMRKAEEIEAQLKQADHTFKHIDEDGPGFNKAQRRFNRCLALSKASLECLEASENLIHETQSDADKAEIKVLKLELNMAIRREGDLIEDNDRLFKLADGCCDIAKKSVALVGHN